MPARDCRCDGRPRHRRAAPDERLAQLLDELAPIAARLGPPEVLRHARELVAAGGAAGQRGAAEDGGVAAATRWLVARFLARDGG
jgi:hypothetical protein